jgi:hypothetical protein
LIVILLIGKGILFDFGKRSKDVWMALKNEKA